MPNYEYKCLDCNKTFITFISYNDYGKIQPTCKHCQSEKIQRTIEKIRITRSSKEHLSEIGNPEALANIDDDPRALGKMMRQMSAEIGENMGNEFDEVVNRLESGQTPEQIEKDLPDIANDTPNISSTPSAPPKTPPSNGED